MVMLVAVMAIAQTADAVVVSDTNVSLSDGAPISDYVLAVFKQETTNPTTMWFDVSGGMLSWANINVDEASDWYLTSYGDAFTQATIQAGDFPIFVRATDTGFESNDLDVGLGDFYLGVNTGYGSRIGLPAPRDVYGWVHLQNSGGTLSMLGNAVAYDEGGIVIGTTQAIPEPPSAALFLSALAAFSVLARRKRGTPSASDGTVA
jgi:hypothetical protein